MQFRPAHYPRKRELATLKRESEVRHSRLERIIVSPGSRMFLSIVILNFLSSSLPAFSCWMHHLAIGLCDLFAVSYRPRQATAEAKSRPFHDSDPFALQFCRKSFVRFSLHQVLTVIIHRGGAGRAGELAYWDKDADHFSRCGWRSRIFSHSCLAVGP